MVYPYPSFDMRDLLKRSREDDKAALAVDMFVYRGVLTPDGNWPVVLDIATDEEAMIARECYRLIPHHQVPSHLQEKIFQYLVAIVGLD
jgi:acetate kinase